MKKLDIYIMRFLIRLGVSILIYGLSTDYVLAMQFIGGVIIGCYLIFFLLHAVLGFPSFALGCLLADTYKGTYNKIHKESAILAKVSRFIFVLGGLIGTHLLWIYIGSAIFLQNPNFGDCWEWFSILME